MRSPHILLFLVLIACGSVTPDQIPDSSPSGADAAPALDADPAPSPDAGTALGACALGTDNCSEDAVCLDTKPQHSCVCKLGFVGTGTQCREQTVLAYDPFGLTHQVGSETGVHFIRAGNQGEFDTKYMAGGFDVVMYVTQDSDTVYNNEHHLIDWVNNGGRLIFQYGKLETRVNLAATLGVSVTDAGDHTEVYAELATRDLFRDEQHLPISLTRGTSMTDHGDELTLSAGGYLAARYGSAAGPGAVAVTHQGRVIVNGFSLLEYLQVDDDGDGLRDLTELYINQLRTLLHRPRGLVFAPDTANAHNAADALGLPFRRVGSLGELESALDESDYDWVLMEVTEGGVPLSTRTRLVSHLDTGAKLIIGFWDLDSDPALQALLRVSAVNYEQWRDVYPDPACAADLFALSDEVAAPLSGTSQLFDNGDELTVTGDGYVCARLDGTNGPGAIAITRGAGVNRDQILINGFLPSSAANSDGDQDGVSDAEEIYRNELELMLRR